MTEEKEWWELLIWENMNQTWARLPEETKNKIREAGLAPRYDTSKQKETSTDKHKKRKLK